MDACPQLHDSVLPCASRDWARWEGNLLGWLSWWNASCRYCMYWHATAACRQAFCSVSRQPGKHTLPTVAWLAWALSADPSARPKLKTGVGSARPAIFISCFRSLSVPSLAGERCGRDCGKFYWKSEAGTSQRSSVRTFCSITRPSHFLSSSCSSLAVPPCLCSDQVSIRLTHKKDA